VRHQSVHLNETTPPGYHFTNVKFVHKFMFSVPVSALVKHSPKL